MAGCEGFYRAPPLILMPCPDAIDGIVTGSLLLAFLFGVWLAMWGDRGRD